MSIIAGATLAGVAVSGYIFDYTKNEYEEKISELDNLIARLNTHLETLRGLRREIPGFWEDDDAKAASEMLDRTIERVVREMGTAEGLARSFRTLVGSLDGGKVRVRELVEQCMGILGGLD